MATVIWTGASQNTAQEITILITATAVGGTVAVSANSVVAATVTYTGVTGDTVSTFASGLQALLASSDAPPEFQEVTWTVDTATITGVANTPGVPFTFTKADAGGATSTLTNTVANVSSNDVNNAKNWIRSGATSIPQNMDDVVLRDSNVSLLWNLSALAAVQFATFTRWNSYTGQIGLPDINPNGYFEYRATYFQFISSAAQFPFYLGYGDGNGPSLERYNVGTQRTNVVAQGGGNGHFDFLGTNANNTILVEGCTGNVAMGSAETSTIASGTVNGGGTLNLGSGVTFSGELTVNQGTVTTYCAPATMTINNGSTVTVGALTLTYATVTASGNSVIIWNSDSTITTLTLQTGASLDKSGDLRPMTITNSTIDGDTCFVNDPQSKITWTNATSVRQAVTSGPFIFQGTRTVKVT